MDSGVCLKQVSDASPFSTSCRIIYSYMLSGTTKEAFWDSGIVGLVIFIS